nr:EOG090X07NR [Cyclestheria hislopi]
MKNAFQFFIVKRMSSRSLQRPKVKFTPSEVQPPQSFHSNPKLMKPFLFTLTFSGTCFCGAAIWQYENMRQKAINMKNAAMGWYQNKTSALQKHGEIRRQLNMWWNHMSEGHKMFYGILFLNSIVFLAWKIPNLQRYMLTYFCSNPFARAVCWPMVLSTFSHYSVLHIVANMYVLHSFSNVAVHVMGKEQFLAFYLSAGVISSFASHAVKVLMKQPGLSLGASGAIMGVLGFFCTQFPNSQLAVAFIPSLNFSADTGLKALIAFDTLGLLLKWKLFDHAAHLGGALFGLVWCHWGQQQFWDRREKIMNVWHDLRRHFRD